MTEDKFSPVIALGQVRYALKSMANGDDQSQALPWMIRLVEASQKEFLPFATIPDPEAFMKAARGMREALEACQSTLQHTRAFMLQKHGTTNPAREEALASAETALLAFDATLGEQ